MSDTPKNSQIKDKDKIENNEVKTKSKILTCKNKNNSKNINEESDDDKIINPKSKAFI